jgi:hypothetical protein
MGKVFPITKKVEYEVSHQDLQVGGSCVGGAFVSESSGLRGSYWQEPSSTNWLLVAIAARECAQVRIF